MFLFISLILLIFQDTKTCWLHSQII